MTAKTAPRPSRVANIRFGVNSASGEYSLSVAKRQKADFARKLPNLRRHFETMFTKILITGANGLLGQKLVVALTQVPGIQVLATGRGPARLPDGLLSKDWKQGSVVYRCMDMTNREEVAQVIEGFGPDTLIHTAAMTQVDDCEKDPEACQKQNVDAVQNLCDACLPLGTHIIHLSTDFIFDGLHGPYAEEAQPGPLSIYGKAKWEAERIVEAYPGPACIARTVLVYGLAADMSRTNIVLWVQKSLQEGKSLRIVSDQYRTPTLAEDLADGCLRIAKLGATGIYNLSGGEFMTVFEMAQRIAHFLGLDASLLHPVTTAELGQPAPRPLRSGFIIDKAVRDLGYQPRTLEQGITLLLQQESQRTSNHLHEQ